VLILSKRMYNTPIMSLQTGDELARTREALIDPRTLDILAYRLSGSHLERPSSMILTRDIREFGSIGIIIDSSDEIIDERDVIKIKKIADLDFRLIGMNVKQKDGKHIGKVHDYALDARTFNIQQLYVKQSIFRSLNTHEVIINRSQILEITNTEIIVRSASVQEKVVPAAPEESGFTNPFRRTAPTQNTTQK
jgi:sporulation protein YlmC with PRC-barrel domain